jgi:hypothetical protein
MYSNMISIAWQRGGRRAASTGLINQKSDVQHQKSKIKNQ